jgi:RND family efflux transporter MFP subunit
MYRKNTAILIGIVLLISGGILFSPGCKQQEETLAETQVPLERAILYYTCGMHLSVNVSPEDYAAGNNKCPICKMDLVPVYKEGEGKMDMEEHKHEADVEAKIKLSPRAQALAQVRTEDVQYRHLTREINTVGQIEWDERRLSSVAAWISGRLDKLFVNYTGVEVKKGSPLALIYSPDLLTTQEEYLLALETHESISLSSDAEAIQGAESLVEAARKRMRLWGVSEDQMRELEKRRTASTHLTIHAPLGGTVIRRDAVEGKYVKEGDPLFQIADSTHLWVMVDVYEYEMADVSVGQPVVLNAAAYPGETFGGKVAFIDPYLNPKTRSLKVRVDVPNPSRRLKPGMYVNASISSHVHQGKHAPQQDMYICTMCPEVKSEEPGECPECGMDLVKKKVSHSGEILAVPREAVLDTGMRKLVYVEKEPGIYAAREVNLGREAMADVEGKRRRFYAVMDGLEEGEAVVIRANFLIDSQSQITGQAEAVYSGALERSEEKKPPAKHIH